MKTTASLDLILVPVQPTKHTMTKVHGHIRGSHELIQTKASLRRVLAKIREVPTMMTGHIPSRMGVGTKEAVMMTLVPIWTSQKVSVLLQRDVFSNL